MKVGDLVKYGSWYTGIPAVGIILETESGGSMPEEKYYLVCWFGNFPTETEWETHEELEAYCESR